MTISIPDTLTVENSINYIMSIRLCPGGLSFSLYKPEDSTSIFLESILFDLGTTFETYLKDIFFENEFFSYRYKKTYVSFVTTQYTLVPAAVFQEKEKKSFADFLFSDYTHILHSSLPAEDIKVVYEMNESTYQFCARSLVSPLFIPHIQPLLSYCRRNSLLSLLKQVYVFVENRRVDIICYQSGRLLFSNSFFWQTTSDLMYLILHIWQQQQMDQQKDQLFLLGKNDIYDDLTPVLSRYIKDITRIVFPSTNQYIKGKPDKGTFDLIALSVCEL